MTLIFFFGGGGGGRGEMENCAYLRKNPGYAPVVVKDLYLSRLRMDANSLWTFFILFDGGRMFARSQLDIKDIIVFTAPDLSTLFQVV